MIIDYITLAQLERRIRWATKAEEFSSADADSLAAAMSLPATDWHYVHRALTGGSLDAAFALVARLMPELDLALRLGRQEWGWRCVVTAGQEEAGGAVHRIAALAVLDALCSIFLSQAEAAVPNTIAAVCVPAPEPAPSKPARQGWMAEAELRVLRSYQSIEPVLSALKTRWYATCEWFLPKASRALYRMAARLEELARAVGAQ